MSDATVAPAISTPSASPLVAFADDDAATFAMPEAPAADWAQAAIEPGHAGDAIDTMRAEAGPDGAPTPSSDLVALAEDGDFFAGAEGLAHDALAMTSPVAPGDGGAWTVSGEGEAGSAMAAGGALDFPRHGYGLDWTDADPLGIG